MDKPIMLTPHDVWNIFLAICGGIVAISAAFAVIIKIIDHFKAPDKKQDERIRLLEVRVDEVDSRLEDGNKHFEQHDMQMKSLEESMKKSNRLVIESLKILIEHDIDGNNIDGLKQMNHKIDNYLLEK